MKKGETHITLYLILVLVIVLIVVGGILLAVYFSDENDQKRNKQIVTPNNNGNSPIEPVYRQAIAEDYANLIEILEQSPMIKDLPNDGVLMLSFYNFDTGERTWEKNFVLKKGNVEEGTTNDYDLKLIMHSKYLTILSSTNLCQVISLAQGNGDFATETDKSTLSLGLKYSSMMEYKDCLGL